MRIGTLLAWAVHWLLECWETGLSFVYNIGLRGFRSSVIAFLFLGGLVVIEQIVAKQQVSHLNQSQEG
jgi:hypothetical protein